MVQASIPDGYVLIKRWQVLAALGGIAVIQLMLLLILVLVVPQIGTNTTQNDRIARLTKSNTRALAQSQIVSLKGCESTNKLRQQSNVRIPAERIELQTALEGAIVLRENGVPVVPGYKVEPKRVKELLASLAPVALRDCKKLYGSE